MNLQHICDLLKNAGSERAIITINTNGDNASVILTVPTSNTVVDIKNSAQVELRNALSIPLAISGQVAEVDAAFNESIADYAQVFILNNSELKNSVTTVKPVTNRSNKSKTTEVTVKPTTPINNVPESPTVKVKDNANVKSEPENAIKTPTPAPDDAFSMGSFFDVQPL
ncbi:hypothetical protein [Photobacterium toruni]|uniref:hypothetical protein n=1 Tax=Photobacterium toruni TaxID=1935446 RepID=UPI00210FA2FC|nr:hypothetical protein [Photobacterium toruni]